MKCLFLDTVGLIALWDRSDQWHKQATEAYQEYHVDGPHSVIVTESAMLECGNAASRRPYRENVAKFRDQMATDRGLVFATDEDTELGWKEYLGGQPGAAGIVDCISFAVMRRLGLTEVFTNDQHFQIAGFETLF